MTPERANWLEALLGDNLRPVAAPDNLLEQLRRPRPQREMVQSRRTGIVFGVAALVAAVLIAAVALPMLDRARKAEMAARVLHSGDPAEIRTWVKNSTGFDVPLAKALPSSIQLVEARSDEPGAAKIVFRLDGRETILSVTAAGGRKPLMQHQQGQRTWQAKGLDYELHGGPAKFDAACMLCHAAM